MQDQSFATVLRTEDAIQRWLALLLKNLSESADGTAAAPAGSAAPRAGAPPMAPGGPQAYPPLVPGQGSAWQQNVTSDN